LYEQGVGDGFYSYVNTLAMFGDLFSLMGIVVIGNSWKVVAEFAL
jgi:hypothetical protein